MTTAPAAGTVPALIAYAVLVGLVGCAADLVLVDKLAAEVVGRREAFLDGAFERKVASVAISRALDWRVEATRLSEAERARAHRAGMLDPTPRQGDYLPGAS
jgi:hypothetical protein